MRARIRDPRKQKWEARRVRVKRRIARRDHVRLTVFRSAKHIYAQLDDPNSGCTVASVSSRSPRLRGELERTGNVEAARRVGRAIGELARGKGIGKVVFNRNGFLYHGRVKALADAAREAGLEF
jgi:large subunit ribosomal protein L18